MNFMNFILLSDIHGTSKNPIGRTDNILETFKNKFIFVLKYAKKNECTILQAGDFLHKSRDWHLLHLMSRLLKKYKVPIYTIYGQHDMYMRSDPRTTPTTLGVLNRSGLVGILDNRKPTILDGVCIYGCSWKSIIPKPNKNRTNILVIHSPITTKELFPKHDFTAVAHFISKNKGWDLILAGDVHAKTIHKGRKTILVNTGSMLRLVSDKYNMSHKPCFFVYNTKSCKLKEVIIPHQDAKVVLTRKHLKRKSLLPKADISSITTLKRFTRLISKQDRKSPSIKEVLNGLMKKYNTSKEVKTFLFGVMEDEY